MIIKYKNIPAFEISLDELREINDSEDEKTLFEFKMGLFYEMDTESIGMRADLSRLFKIGFFSPSEKKALIKKLGDYKLNAAERKAYQRSVRKLRKYFLK